MAVASIAAPMSGTGVMSGTTGRAMGTVAPTLWQPTDLASLVAWWNADDHGTASMTDDGAGLISSWKDRLGSIDLTAVTTARPTWTATGFKSKYAGVTFNGTANALVTTSLGALPVSTASSTEFALAGNTATSGARCIFSYGDAAGATVRRMNQNSGTPPLNTLSDGAVATTNTGSAAAGDHIIGGAFGGGSIAGRFDGSAFGGAPVAATLATGTTRARMGAATGAGATQFWQGPVRHFLVFDAVLSLADQQRVEGWLAWDARMTSQLPTAHPYKSVRP